MTSKRFSGLASRVATGVVGGAALLALMGWGGRAGTALVALVVSLVMTFEFASTAFKLRDRNFKTGLSLVLVFLLHVFCYGFPHAMTEIFLCTALVGCAIFMIQTRVFAETDLREHVSELVFGVFCLLYTGLLPVFLPVIRQMDRGFFWVLLCLIVVWSTDTGAYFAGSTLGKHRLFAKVSPQKSIEGLVGGIAAAVVAAAFFTRAYLPDMNLALILSFVVFLSIWSQVGDLCESLLKRGFGIKDFGSILPGHGGFLDRFDGVVFSLPVMYTFVKALISD